MGRTGGGHTSVAVVVRTLFAGGSLVNSDGKVLCAEEEGGPGRQ